MQYVLPTAEDKMKRQERKKTTKSMFQDAMAEMHGSADEESRYYEYSKAKAKAGESPNDAYLNDNFHVSVKLNRNGEIVPLNSHDESQFRGAVTREELEKEFELDDGVGGNNENNAMEVRNIQELILHRN